MRKHYLDNIRWFTVLLVGLYHVIYMYNGVAPFGVVGPFKEVQYQDAFLYMCYPWFMLLLFIVAGISSRLYLEKHTVKEFIGSRTTKLLVPSTIGVFVWGWAQGYVNMQLSGASMIPEEIPIVIKYIIMCLSGIGVLWFAQLLWLFSLVLAIIRKLEKGKFYKSTKKTNTLGLFLLVIPVFMSGMVLNTPLILVYRFGYYGMGFLIGYFVFAHEEVIDRLAEYRYVSIAAAVIFGGLFIYRRFGQNYAEPSCYKGWDTVAFAWATCLAIFGSFKTWFNTSNKVTKFMAKRSFGFYVLHYFTLSGAALLLKKYTAIPALPTYLIAFIAAFAGGFLLNEIISGIPFIRWCVLGIKKEKKNVCR